MAEFCQECHDQLLGHDIECGLSGLISEEKVNEGDPLWLKDKKDIKEEDYKQFYKNISFYFLYYS